MNEMTVNLELMTFVEGKIIPRYQAFDAAPRSEHVQRVIRESLALAKRLGADINMCYVIAAYHDLGMEGPRAVHHKRSGEILQADKRLLKWFSPAQITIMKEAVEDHRASAAKAPRSLYGKIVAEADRELEPETVMRRTILFGLSNYPELSYEEQYERFLKHITDKYNTDGYLRLWIPGSENEKRLNELRNMIANKELLRKEFERLYAETLIHKELRTD